MAYRNLTRREVKALCGLGRAWLPAYIRMLSGGGVRYRDIAAALGCSESRIADIAAEGRPPVRDQRVPPGFAGYLRQLRGERHPDLNATLAAAVDRGWTHAALSAALGVTPQAVRARAVRGAHVPRQRDAYIPAPDRGHDV